MYVPDSLLSEPELPPEHEGARVTVTDHVSRRPEMIRLATAAYHAGHVGDWQKAADVLGELNLDHPDDGLTTAMLAWIDTAIAAAGLTVEGQLRLAWLAVETGDVHTDADAVAPESRWAGRLLAARLADDEPGFRALLSVLPTLTPTEAGDHVLNLLQMCVLTVQRGPQSGRLPEESTR